METQVMEKVIGLDGMKEEEPAVKTEVETDTEVAGDGMEEEEPAVTFEIETDTEDTDDDMNEEDWPVVKLEPVETDTDVADNRPTEGFERYSADDPSDKTEVNLEIDGAEDPSLSLGMMAEQHTHGGALSHQQQAAKAMGNWAARKPGTQPFKPKPKGPPRLHYCDVCKISCVGPETYHEHMEGQKHKKKAAAAAVKGAPVPLMRWGHQQPRCELCDVTCTGVDAYAAHIRGAKHQRVVNLHTKLGKPIPYKTATTTASIVANDEDNLNILGEKDVAPVGHEYMEEVCNEQGKTVSFNCKLCECKFNDPNSKEMHLKGRRHRIQYKNKIDPNLHVAMKPSILARKVQDDQLRRQAQTEEFWRRREQVGVKPSNRARRVQEDQLRRQAQNEEFWRRKEQEDRWRGGMWPPFRTEEETYWEQQRRQDMEYFPRGPMGGPFMGGPGALMAQATGKKRGKKRGGT